MATNGFRDLKVWQKGMDLVVAIYRETKSFPADERFALTQQVHRAVVSVVANIAEGHGRATKGAFAHSLSIARGSLKELETLCEIAYRLDYLLEDQRDALVARCVEVSKMLTALKQNIRC